MPIMNVPRETPLNKVRGVLRNTLKHGLTLTQGGRLYKVVIV